MQMTLTLQANKGQRSWTLSILGKCCWTLWLLTVLLSFEVPTLKWEAWSMYYPCLTSVIVHLVSSFIQLKLHSEIQNKEILAHYCHGQVYQTACGQGQSCYFDWVKWHIECHAKSWSNVFTIRAINWSQSAVNYVMAGSNPGLPVLSQMLYQFS